MELLKVDTIASARDKLMKAIENKKPDTIQIDLLSSSGYILAQDIIAKESVPAFRRSSVDGYAVIAHNTLGASESVPTFLKIVDEIMMGSFAGKEIQSGECAYVPTGGMIPDGADAVVMVEYCETFGSSQVAVYHSVASGKNIVMVGEDIIKGEMVLRRGTRIRPQEIGALACLGITRVTVYRPWTISIISTGDELVSPQETPPLGKIRDINTYALSAQASKHGLNVRNTSVLKDEEQLLKDVIIRDMQESDIVVISGGSSQGKKDATKKIIDEVARSGAFTHGLAIKPGKPTILGYDEDTKTLLTGLPGHPVAAILVFEMLINWLWRQMTYQKSNQSVYARITSNLASASGKMTCQLVKLIRQDEGYHAEPIFGKSGLITTLTRADGYILIDQNKEGLQKDEIVEVFYL